MADALAIYASAIVVALIWAGGFRTVGAFPSYVTEAAAGVVLVGTMATTAFVHALIKRYANTAGVKRSE